MFVCHVIGRYPSMYVTNCLLDSLCSYSIVFERDIYAHNKNTKSSNVVSKVPILTLKVCQRTSKIVKMLPYWQPFGHHNTIFVSLTTQQLPVRQHYRVFQGKTLLVFLIPCRSYGYFLLNIFHNSSWSINS